MKRITAALTPEKFLEICQKRLFVRIALVERMDNTGEELYIDLDLEAYTIVDRDGTPVLARLHYSKQLPSRRWSRPEVKIEIFGGFKPTNIKEALTILNRWRNEFPFWLTESIAAAYWKRLGEVGYRKFQLAYPVLMWQYHYLLAILDVREKMGKHIPSELYSRFNGFLRDQCYEWENVFGPMTGSW